MLPNTNTISDIRKCIFKPSPVARYVPISLFNIVSLYDASAFLKFRASCSFVDADKKVAREPHTEETGYGSSMRINKFRIAVFQLREIANLMGNEIPSDFRD